MATMARTVPNVKKAISTEDRSYIPVLNSQIMMLVRNAVPLSLKNPDMAAFLFKSMYRQKRAADRRAAYEKQGLHVPAFMIASITHRCNLRCRGCYAWAQHGLPEMNLEMSAEKLRNTVKEAKELGISIILTAGGEPLTRPEIVDIMRDFPEIIFPLFTNGTLIDAEKVRQFKTQRNVIPVVSLEGHRAETDARRGAGTYERVINVMNTMKKQGIFFGTSITVTRENFGAVTDEGFVKELVSAGCRLFFFVDYVPVEEGTEDLTLTDAQREREARMVAKFRKEMPALFIAFPGDEEMYGGCLAAGRGFIHVNPEGDVEPCPASPYSDSSLNKYSLKEALQSPLLRAIRESGADLHETKGGCALFQKQEWVRSLIAN